jgi:alpha-D-ribose 1-methylphosphonate 5-triphosphate synthase subunit PhnH
MAVILGIVVGISLRGIGQKVMPPQTIQSAKPAADMLKSDLTPDQMVAFQAILAQYGHPGFKVIRGQAWATQAELDDQTMAIVLMCTDKACCVSWVGIQVTKGEITKIQIQTSGERMPSP